IGCPPSHSWCLALSGINSRARVCLADNITDIAPMRICCAFLSVCSFLYVSVVDSFLPHKLGLLLSSLSWKYLRECESSLLYHYFSQRSKTGRRRRRGERGSDCVSESPPEQGRERPATLEDVKGKSH